MGEVDQVADEHDGLHALDRDYTVKEKPKPRQLRFSKVPAINLGVICFLLGGVSLLIGVVASQWNPMSQATTARVVVAHRIGMWLVLAGGASVFVGIRARSELYVQRRKRGKRPKSTLRFVIQAKSGGKPLTLNSWREAMIEFGFLVPSTISADVLRPEVGDVHLVIHQVVLAVLRWDPDRDGVIHLVMRKTDRARVQNCCQELLDFLDARLIEEVEAGVGERV